jgi:prophage antirepressor-like protein
VLTDVCKAVGIENAPMVALRLDVDEKASISITDRRGIPHETTIVTRPWMAHVFSKLPNW